MQKTIVRKEEVVALSERDLKIFQMIADDKSRDEIAEAIGKSVRTVESEIYRILSRVGCNSQEAAIALFLRNKLIK
jgi:DNA-binding CsgD family transcriptional regulator